MRAIARPVQCAEDACPVPRGWRARCRHLGFGVLVAFTIKGLCTTTLIIYTLAAGLEDGEPGLMPLLAVWAIACGAGFALLRRRGANKQTGQ